MKYFLAAITTLVSRIASRFDVKPPANDPIPARSVSGQSSPPGEQLATDPIAAAFTQAEDRGSAAAAAGDVLTQDKAKEEVLREAVIGDFRRLCKGPFAPAKNPDDRELQAELDATTKRIGAIEDDLQRSRGSADDALTASQLPEPPPKAPAGVMTLGVMVLGMPFGAAFTLLPVFSAFDNDLLSWIICHLLGCVAAGLVVAALFYVEPYDERTSPVKISDSGWRQSGAGWATIVGFTCLRTGFSQGWEGFWETVAFTGIETGALLYLKSAAAPFRLTYDAWRERNEGGPQGRRIADLAQAQVPKIERELEAEKAKLAGSRRKLEYRMLFDFDAEKLGRAAAAKCIASFHRGIDENRARRVAGRHMNQGKKGK